MESGTGGADTFGVEQIAEIGVWMRVYLPLTFGQLRSAVAAGTVSAPRIGFAVTPALREWYVSGDTEELEYAAPDRRGRRVLAAVGGRTRGRGPSGGGRGRCGRRFGAIHPGPAPGGPGCVGREVPFLDVASVHVDDPAAVAEVALAAAAVAAADAGDPDAAFVVAGLEDHELQWYAVQELTDLLAE